MEDIAIFYKDLVKLTGLPLWVLIVLLIFFTIAVYLFGILIPLSIRKIRKEVINLNQKFEIFSGEQIFDILGTNNQLMIAQNLSLIY
jgi:hypothetical protein